MLTRIIRLAAERVLAGMLDLSLVLDKAAHTHKILLPLADAFAGMTLKLTQVVGGKDLVYELAEVP